MKKLTMSRILSGKSSLLSSRETKRAGMWSEMMRSGLDVN